MISCRSFYCSISRLSVDIVYVLHSRTYFSKDKVVGLSHACSHVKTVDMAITPLMKQHFAF